MKIALASDHAGFALKSQLATALAADGHDVLDLGTDGADSVDYPLYAAPAARLVADGEAERGVLVCGSGNGVAIVANKLPGVRAVNAHDVEEAEMCRRHNDANVVALSGARLDVEAATAIVRTFLATALRRRPPRAPRRCRSARWKRPRRRPPHDRAAARLLHPPARGGRPGDRRRARSTSSSASSARWR